MMILSDLPKDILKCILSHVGFREWVFLTHANSQFRSTFDPEEFLHFVFENIFRENIQNFDYRPPTITKVKLRRIFYELWGFFYSELSLQDLTELDERVEKALILFQDPEAYHPLASTYQKEHKRVRDELEKSCQPNEEYLDGVDFGDLSVIWKSLALQNFLRAGDYLRGKDMITSIEADFVEKAYFENCRFDADFIRFAPARYRRSLRINAALDKFLHPYHPNYDFATVEDFRIFIKGFAETVKAELIDFPREPANGPHTLCSIGVTLKKMKTCTSCP